MSLLWFSGVESGDLSEFNDLGGTRSASTAVVKSGAYSAKTTATQNGVQNWVGSNTIQASTTLYFRSYCYIDLTANPTGGNSTENFFVDVESSGGGAADAGVFLDVSTSGVITAHARHTGGATVNGSVNTVLNNNQWYLIEVKVTASTSVGVVEWKLDGVLQETLANQNIASNQWVRVYGIAHLNGSGSGAMAIYFDDLSVSDSAYPGPGKCIARQGKAGTPTYDAWTKTSSQTAAQVWSETPFSATNNAALAGTGAGAQTMLTESFSTTQSGHGTETIASGDTINACKVGLVAKVSSTSSPPTFSIRQRLNSVDTDLAKVLTTGDVYYEGAIFTDTLTNLNASEIGAVRGTSAATKTDTVEDVWMFVDYTAAPAAFTGGLALMGVGQ